MNLSSGLLYLIICYFCPVVFCENSLLCEQVQNRKKSSICHVKYENPAIRAFSRKKRFIVFPNYCAMKITVATGKKVIVQYPRGINLSLEVSVYYPLPTILEEWYPKVFRSSTTPKPKIPKRKNPPIFSRVDTVDPVNLVNSPADKFDNLHYHGVDKLIGSSSISGIEKVQIPPDSFKKPHRINIDKWKSKYSWRNSTNWNKSQWKTISPIHFPNKVYMMFYRPSLTFSEFILLCLLL